MADENVGKQAQEEAEKLKKRIQRGVNYFRRIESPEEFMLLAQELDSQAKLQLTFFLQSVAKIRAK